MGPWRSNARIPFCGLQHPETTPPSQKSTTSQTAPRTHDDLADVDILRLLDCVAHRTGDGVRLERYGAVGPHQLGGGGIGDRVSEFTFHDAGMDAGDADPVILLSQAIRDRPHGKLRRAIDGSRWRDCQSTDRGNIDDVARAARPHLRQHGSDTVEHALDVDIDHPVPFVDLE